MFGRSRILLLAARGTTPAQVLEVGCGTGHNLAHLGHLFPRARFTGVNLSSSMLKYARRRTAFMRDRVELVQQRYSRPLAPDRRFDLVIFSYSLTMFNPGFEQAIDAAWHDLAPGGHVACVDFYRSRWPWFLRWMQLNHVRMDGHLPPLLAQTFEPLHSEIHRAYGGVWQYALFIGRKA